MNTIDPVGGDMQSLAVPGSRAEPPRLVLYTAVFPQLSETFIVSKFLGLLARGWDVHMVCSEFNREQWRQFVNLAAEKGARQRVHAGWLSRPRWLAALLLPFAWLRCLVQNPGGTLRYTREAMQRWGVVGGLRRFYVDAPIIALRPDLVHFEFGALAVERADIKHLLGCKVTVSFRGYDLNFSGLDQPGYYDSVWRNADALHLLGEDLWRRAVWRGCPETKPHGLIPPAVDLEHFPPSAEKETVILGTASRPLRILSVGRLEWKKGYEFALQAVRLLRDDGIACDYRIVGNGAFLEPLTFARRQLGLEDCVSFTGSLPHQEALEHMSWADVFLHPSLSEGFCNVVLEAQAAGVPVVCSDAGGLVENIADGETGFLVPRRDPAAMAEKLERLAREPELRRGMGAAGRRRVQERFGLARQLERFDAFYREVASRAD